MRNHGLLNSEFDEIKSDSPEQVTKGSTVVYDENSDSLNLVGIGHIVGLHGLYFFLFLFYRTQVRPKSTHVTK